VGKQVTFFLLPGDLIALETEIARLQPFVVLHSRSPSNEPKRLSALDPAKSGEDWLHLFLVRPDDVLHVVSQHVPAQGYWAVDSLLSPVIEFQRCFFDGGQLRRGRAYFNETFYDSSKALVQKPEAFTNWARSVLSVIRKNLNRQGGDYLGSEAKRWLAGDGGSLVD
jgi:hypothetical protein